jgi:hypothetical protein
MSVTRRTLRAARTRRTACDRPVIGRADELCADRLFPRPGLRGVLVYELRTSLITSLVMDDRGASRIGQTHGHRDIPPF